MSRAAFPLIEKIFNQLSPSVAIALLKNDRLAYEFYGGRSPIGESTRFNIGTASAVFTGAVVVKLMEFGEIGLAAPVRRYIPEFRFGDVTVFHLLTHTSGLVSGTLPLPDNHSAKKAFYRGLYDGCGRGATPGVVCGPYPYGYAVLADIAERVGGQTLGELASALIFLPLGMKFTTYGAASLTEDQLVVPWNHMENRFMGELRAKQPMGHTGVYTTALDLIRFGRMFLNGGAVDGRQVFLESSVGFMLRDITGGRFARTPVFMVKAGRDATGCFSERHSGGAVALTGDTGSLLFIDPGHKAVGAALANSTWVHGVSGNYANIGDILMGIE